eukprot:m.18180 g.18180  ORF g.18180 m.18180 type:complete len:1093 (-) comp3573_c0_seq1:644-3922(-)
MSRRLDPDELYDRGFKPAEARERLPSWYHGMIQRQEAETILKEQPRVVDGLFLIRKSTRSKGFVLSLVQFGGIAHFEIKHETLDGRDFLTFDTEQAGHVPLFRSLCGVVNYLISKPKHLDVPLTRWVPCTSNPEQPHMARGGIAFNGAVSQTLAGALSDTLAELTEDEDVYGHPAAYAMDHPTVLACKPQFLVLWNTLPTCPLAPNDVITLVRTERDAYTGRTVIVCVDTAQRTHRLLDDCEDIEVVPYKVSGHSGSRSGSVSESQGRPHSTRTASPGPASVAAARSTTATAREAGVGARTAPPPSRPAPTLTTPGSTNQPAVPTHSTSLGSASASTHGLLGGPPSAASLSRTAPPPARPAPKLSTSGLTTLANNTSNSPTAVPSSPHGHLASTRDPDDVLPPPPPPARQESAPELPARPRQQSASASALPSRPGESHARPGPRRASDPTTTRQGRAVGTASKDKTTTTTTTKRAYHQFRLAKSGSEVKPMVVSAAPGTGYYYREVIKEGWLRKLPPMHKLKKSWKSRWFKLCVVISSSESSGPVMLEYYDKETSTKPKGEINLSDATRICPVESGDCRTSVLKKVDPDLLLLIELPNRTYPLQARQKSDVNEWITAFNETLGIDSQGEHLPSARPTPPLHQPLLASFTGKLVLCGQNGQSGYTCTVTIGERVLTVDGDGGRADQHREWRLADMTRFGFVKQLVWFDAVITCDHPGIFCIATPNAEQAHATLEDHIKRMAGTSAVACRRRSVRTHMGWTAIKTPPTLSAGTGSGGSGATTASRQAAPPPLPPPTDTDMVVIFGKTIPMSDLEHGGIAFVTTSHTASKAQPGEVTLVKGASLTILTTKQFLSNGYWLTDLSAPVGCSPRSSSHDSGPTPSLASPPARTQPSSASRYGLIKADCVQLHRHGFSYMDEDSNDDTGPSTPDMIMPGALYAEPDDVDADVKTARPAMEDSRATYLVPMRGPGAGDHASYEVPDSGRGDEAYAVPDSGDEVTSSRPTSHASSSEGNPTTLRESHRMLPIYATSPPPLPPEEHTKYDYENAAAIKDNEQRKRGAKRIIAPPGAHYVNREVMGSQTSMSQPVLFGNMKKK